MRKNRMLPILGLALALPMLIASLAFACDGDKTSASSASTQQASSKAGCAAKCTGAAKAASASSCPASSCAGKAAAAGSHCAGKSADAAAAGSHCAGKAVQTADAAGHCDGAGCAKACCAGRSAAMITYSVSGMTCMGCVKQVEAAVAKLELENLESVSVNLDDHNAVVTTTGPVDAMAVATAITSAGFPAEFSKAVHPEAADKDQAKPETEEPAATM